MLMILKERRGWVWEGGIGREVVEGSVTEVRGVMFNCFEMTIQLEKISELIYKFGELERYEE